MVHLSIILPCYNPLPGWHEHISDSVRKIKQSIPDIELIIVNDGSRKSVADGIAILQKEFSELKYIHYTENKGKGYAIRQGLQEATGKLIIYTDIDFPYTHESFMRVYEVLAADKCDIAVGVKDEVYYQHVPLLRKWTSRTLRFMTSKLLRIGITDTQCGLKGLNQHAAKVLGKGQINRYLFDLEMIYNAERMKQRLLPVPVSLREGVAFSKVKMKILMRELSNFVVIIFKK